MTDSMQCTFCKGDVSASKRVRDNKGRTYCVSCARAKFGDKVGGTQASETSQPASPGAITPPAPILPRPASRIPASNADARSDGEIALDLASHVPQPAPTKACYECKQPMSVDAKICMSCGYNTLTGRVVDREAPIGTSKNDRAKKRAKPTACMNCGYDMKGLVSKRCPECGVVNDRFATSRFEQKHELRKMYIKPLIGAGIGLACILLIALAGHGVGGVIFYGLYYPIAVVVTFFAYVGCSIAFIGFDEPMGVTFVRTAFVVAVYNVLGAALDLVPYLPWMVEYPIRSIVFVGLLVQIMDIELEDAWMVCLVIFLLNTAMFIGLLKVFGMI